MSLPEYAPDIYERTVTMKISITSESGSVTNCTSVVIVPEIAAREAGYIKALTGGAKSGAKHEFHALAQMAYFQFQDDELEAEPLEGIYHIVKDNSVETLESGILIYRNEAGEIHIASHSGVNCKKLLEAAHRYCTRWVRLDI